MKKDVKNIEKRNGFNIAGKVEIKTEYEGGKHW